MSLFLRITFLLYLLSDVLSVLLRNNNKKKIPSTSSRKRSMGPFDPSAEGVVLGQQKKKAAIKGKPRKAEGKAREYYCSFAEGV